MLVGMLSRLCAVRGCVINIHSLDVALARLSEAVFCSWDLPTWRMWGVGVPLLRVTIDFLVSVKFSLRMGVLVEQHGIVLGVSLPLPFGLVIKWTL